MLAWVLLILLRSASTPAAVSTPLHETKQNSQHRCSTEVLTGVQVLFIMSVGPDPGRVYHPHFLGSLKHLSRCCKRSSCGRNTGGNRLIRFPWGCSTCRRLQRYWWLWHGRLRPGHLWQLWVNSSNVNLRSVLSLLRGNGPERPWKLSGELLKRSSAQNFSPLSVRLPS